jgi:hypothetical protein
MADRESPRPPSGNGWGHMSKTLALWGLGLVIVIALFQVMSKQTAPAAFTYSEFSRQLDGGNVAAVEMIDGKRLRGQFRTAVDHENQQV